MAASHALTSDPLADSTLATLQALRDRPARPVHPIPAAHLTEPGPGHALSAELFITNLQRARRGAAPGPSGCTNAHLRVLLNSEDDLSLLHRAAQQLVDATVPPPILDALRLGRMVALRKGDGRVRGLVLGDTFRRLLSRTLAQTFGAAFDAACAPHQFALSTRAGAEALTRAVRARLALDDQATVVSIDGIGAYDHVSRAAILAALHRNPHLTGLLPYVRQFYSSPSSYVWYDRHRTAHHVAQGEGGEQGDPLMPCLFAAALHPALTAIQQAIPPGDGCLAFLDDVYLLTSPERAVPTFHIARDAILQHAGINLHQGKTRVWNKAGSTPANIHTLQPVGQDARVWVGDQTLPPTEQGLQVLGAPIGSLAYIEAALARTTAKHAVLIDRITAVPDLQCAYLLLTYCANTRATYLLRALPPILTQAFARAHDAAAAATLAHLLGHGAPGLPDAPLARARLPFRCGGLGLRSAADSRHEAHWASWADTLPTLQNRLPGLADHILHLLTGEARAIPADVDAARRAATAVRNAGFAVPPWEALPAAPPPHPNDGRLPDPARGWQRAACRARDNAEFAALLSTLDTAGRALMLSQAGTHASRAITAFPTAIEFRFENPLFRILLLRRLRLPLPPTAHTCSCRRPLDALGDHRAACAQAGVLRSRAVPLERALARICREAGARVATNVPLSRMNLDAPILDHRTIEVLANGLPLFHGAQLAVDTTLVSPVGRDGTARVQAHLIPGAALTAAEQRKRRYVYPELHTAARCRLVIIALEIGGRWSEEAADFIRRAASARARGDPVSLRRAAAAAYAHRWVGIASVAAQRALASSLLELPVSEDGVDGEEADFPTVLAEASWDEPPAPSRLGPRWPAQTVKKGWGRKKKKDVTFVPSPGAGDGCQEKLGANFSVVNVCGGPPHLATYCLLMEEIRRSPLEMCKTL